jgi:hypothetical protein
MAGHKKARQYFEEVVIPAIEELVNEYNQKRGYWAGAHEDSTLKAGKARLSFGEVHGIHLIYPNGTEKKVSVHWPAYSDNVIIGVDGVKGITTLPMREADKELLRSEIRKILDLFGIELSGR